MGLENESQIGCNQNIQPDWGEGHVRSVGELHLGTYLYHTELIGSTGTGRAFITQGKTSLIEILELPNDAEQSVIVRIDEGHGSDNRSVPLYNLGLEPYQGRWLWNWLQELPVTKNGHNHEASRALILSL